ncbi:MAG: type I restriction-modification system subunit M [Ignavibacteriaceae bacterium]
MPLKKSELYSSIWKSCDELRGGMDASQYKDYVLVILFIKYISDKYAGVPYAPITVPMGASFKDMVALKGKATIGDDINKKIIAKIAEANKLTGTIDVANFNDPEKLGSGKDMVDKLTKLIAIFESPSLDFSKNRAEGDDLLGDAYEFLMKNFATESGKSKGQFYTPAEVSRIMAKVIGINPRVTNAQTTVYDPTCGSGSLLLKVSDETDKNISLFGQEMDVATAALARMNMVLHNHASDIQTIKQGNTLASPLFHDEQNRLRTFDYAVANPPFSYKSWSNGLTAQDGSINDPFKRFDGFGIPPNKNGDFAFLLHIIRSLKSKGKGACILPHGVLFRGNAEAEIRKNILRRGYIKGIIGLPANLFYGTGIPACIIVLDKENAEARKAVFMIDASKGFVKDGNKNRLRYQDLHKIVDVFNNQIEIPKYSRVVPLSEIEKNEYNLNIPRYIDSSEPEDTQDIEAHLKGGIPNADIDALQNYWNVYPSLRTVLFATSKRKCYSKLNVESSEIKNLIFNHTEFVAYREKIDKVFNTWKKKNTAILKNLSVGSKPKVVIYNLSEDLLQAFSNLQLIDKYDIYQHLMTYWAETMQDDVFQIGSEGWKVEFLYDEKKKEFECDLLPKHYVIDRYFVNEKREIENLEAERESVVSKMEEMVEEQSGEDDPFEEAKTEKGKVTKALLVKRIKELEKEEPQVILSKAAEPKVPYKGIATEEDELTILKSFLELIEQEADLKKKVKKAEEELLEKLKAKYKKLSEPEIKELIVTDKWMTAIGNDVKSDMDRISQRLTQRIKELAERYQSPLPAIEMEVSAVEKKVSNHLKKMGFVV